MDHPSGRDLAENRAEQSPAQIEAEIEATRARLAGTVDELAVRVHPKTIAQRTVADTKARAYTATHTADGSLRTERIAAVGGAAAVVVAALVWLRRRRG